MAACGELIRSFLPAIDDEIYNYVEGVLSNNADDFVTVRDIYEAVGELLEACHNGHGDDNDIMDLCGRLHRILKNDDALADSATTRVLEKPINLSEMEMTREEDDLETTSVWMAKKDLGTRVDQKKLRKAEAKLRGKQEKRGTGYEESRPVYTPSTATASQMISRKDNRQEAKGTNNTRDIHVENFDITVGDKCLIKGADMSLVYGRRYGFVGRNGLGKTTLLSMISNGGLVIPSHITMLHVEQEVVGDETIALQSVLECDLVRQGLLQEERTITEKLNAGSEDPELQSRLAAVYAELQHIEADKAPARASCILFGLGFTPSMQCKTTKEFSGGWRMRLALARALFSMPDLLLLDEPTNMLDMKAIIWLENYLMKWPSTLLVVSHDRHFLDIVPTDILCLHSQRLDAYKGNYQNYVKSKEEKMKNQIREYEAQQQFKAHVQEFIDKFRFNAKRASLVQSKIKMLEKLPVVPAVAKETEVVFRFPEAELLSPPILQLDEVSFGYVPSNIFLHKVNLSANMTSRICIVGDNGAGKTTLLKLLLGDLEPISGTRIGHRSLRIGYFSQHHLDQLDMNVCSVELLAKRFPGKPVEEYRRQLGSFGVSGDLALQQVAILSGGQKSRVAFAAMCMTNPNFFILDEPTNHLDVESIEALANALSVFKGGVVLVSHDERLIRSMCKELWVCGGGSVKCVPGGFDEYRKIVEIELELVAKPGR